jgi:subtilisin family serine protease
VGSLDGSRDQVFLITAPDIVNPGLFLTALAIQPGVVDAEQDLLARIPQVPQGAVPSGLWDSHPLVYGGGNVWRGYAAQPATGIIRLASAQSTFQVDGTGIVAIVDTGIDPNHPAFQGVLVPGYDFTRDTSGYGSEMGDVNQSTAAVVDGSSPTAVSPWTMAVIDPITATILRQPQYAAFGHGTMVAGIVHLVAPGAQIMSLKAFRPDGSGYTSDIIRAIYYSVQRNARILQMSFSLPAYSEEVKRAIDFAGSSGVISAASVGNDGKKMLAYPASLDHVLGVASTTDTDQRSSFSNYGHPPVWVAAPGEAIISTYPFGTYGAGWGTSFSTPFVSGTAALLLDVRPTWDPAQVAQAVAHAKPIGPDMGNGRLDVYQAVQFWLHPQ